METFFRAPRTFVKIPVNNDFMTVRFQASEPRHKLRGFYGTAPDDDNPGLQEGNKRLPRAGQF